MAGFDAGFSFENLFLNPNKKFKKFLLKKEKNIILKM